MSEDQILDGGMRPCGGCTACCYTHEVGDHRPVKYIFTLCPDCVLGEGCKIYNEKPRSCSNYYCLWAQGEIGTDEDRPDKVGAVAGFSSMRFDKDDPEVIHLMETHTGAFQEDITKTFIANILASGRAVACKATTREMTYHVLRGNSAMESYAEKIQKHVRSARLVYHES